MTLPDRLEQLRSVSRSRVPWDPADKPILVADGVARPVAAIGSPTTAEEAYVVGINERWFGALCAQLDARLLHFYEMRVESPVPLSRLPHLQQLAICWNTRLRDLAWLTELPGLACLILEDTPKVSDLAPIAALHQLQALEFSGGIWNRNQAVSLEPLAGLPALQELRLLNLRVEQDGLRPLAKCAALRKLDVSNQFPTADYAYLSVHLSRVACPLLAPWVEIPEPIGGKDVMVVGSRKPLLNRVQDAQRLRKYEAAFRKLQEQFAASEPDSG